MFYVSNLSREHLNYFLPSECLVTAHFMLLRYKVVFLNGDDS